MQLYIIFSELSLLILCSTYWLFHPVILVTAQKDNKPTGICCGVHYDIVLIHNQNQPIGIGCFGSSQYHQWCTECCGNTANIYNTHKEGLFSYHVPVFVTRPGYCSKGSSRISDVTNHYWNVYVIRKMTNGK